MAKTDMLTCEKTLELYWRGGRGKGRNVMPVLKPIASRLVE